MSFGLLIIRLAVGLTLAAHGTQKLFGWFGGGGLSATSQMFEKIGLRPPRVHARLAGLAETCGGLMLAVGLLTPAAAAMILAVMIAAVPLVHLDHGFFAVNGGWEYNLVLAASALGVAFAGPGAFSLDSMLGLSWGEQWGFAALIVGIIAGAAVVLARNAAQRRHAPPGERRNRRVEKRTHPVHVRQAVPLCR